MFIGKYNKSVIVTYLGVTFAVLAMNFAFIGKLRYTMIFFIAAAVCDLFDGKIARMCKRDEEEKAFGIQIDSLADIISYVALPVVIGYSLGLNRWYMILAYVALILAGVIRLGFFNVCASSLDDKPVKNYKGLPVTSTAIIIPLIWFLSELIGFSFKACFPWMLYIIAILFILNIKVPKIKGIGYIITAIIAAIGVIILWFI